MKTRCHFLFFISLLTIINGYSQNIESVKRKLVKDLTPKATKYFWTLQQSDTQIELRYIDTFFINTSINPLYNCNGIYNKLDTLYIQIHLEDHWTQHRYDSLRSLQKAILDAMINRFIAYYDSLNWRGVRADKTMFLYQPVFYLTLWDGLTQNERSQLKNLVRFPDKINKEVGLFIESSLRCYAMIEPKEVSIKVDTAYQSFSEAIGVSLYVCENSYK